MNNIFCAACLIEFDAATALIDLDSADEHLAICPDCARDFDADRLATPESLGF